MIAPRQAGTLHQHCAEEHTHRYLAEFDFRCNHRVKLGFSDVEQTMEAIRGLRASASRIQSTGRA
jgi:hypothetical protein